MSAIFFRAMRPLSSAVFGRRRGPAPSWRRSRPAEGIGQPAEGLLLLDKAQDVAVGILEPGGLEAARADVKVAARLEPRKVVLLERDSLFLQLTDLGLDIVDVEVERGRLVRSGKVGLVDVNGRVTALQRHTFAPILLGPEAQYVLVKLARAVDVLDRDHRGGIGLAQHRSSPAA